MALNTQFSFSQGIDMVQTVNYFNEKLGQDVRLDVVTMARSDMML